jgi:superfamily I DNA/RNA helicase
MFAARRARKGDLAPVRVLVLTYNRTLAGYVRSLAEHQISDDLEVELGIETFGRWAMSALGFPDVANNRARAELARLARRLGALSPDYIVKEAEYLLGRFEPEDLEKYITTERTGRGALPRVDRNLRRRILSEVIEPYLAWLERESVLDWNSVAIQMARDVGSIGYDVVIVDESQDFSANQLRAIKQHLAADHAITFVIDTVQRIYARGFTWVEAGYDVRPERVHVLRANHRNTVEIATFAAGILNGIGIEGDGVLPNLEGAMTHGPTPIVLRGRYAEQAAWAIGYIRRHVNLDEDSVAFLKPQGGNWFGQIRTMLRANGIDFADITREADWPEGPVNVAL